MKELLELEYLKAQSDFLDNAKILDLMVAEQENSVNSAIIA